MTAIAFGAALVSTDAPATGAQPGLPLLSVGLAPGVPRPAVPVTPIRFGEQLRQSLAADALAPLNLAPRVTEQPKSDEAVVEQSDEATEDAATIDTLVTFPGLITFTQPVSVPLEYAQRSTNFAQQPQVQKQLPVAPVSQPTQSAGSRQQTLLNVLAAVPETSALGALTINTPAFSLATKGAAPAALTDSQSTLTVTQLASLTNAGLAQALVEGFNQQPGVLAPVSAQQPAQALSTQRSALEVALGDRLQLQITQRSEHAVIRLDPPSMGTIEIVIQREGGNLQVHLRASNAEVVRQLHGIGDSLRQDLIHRQNGDVSVHVSDSSREQHASQQGQRQSQSQREAPGRALSEPNEESAKTFTLAVDEERGA
ncbi:flagellar hook-length control protein FliK [Peristeroidobacter agariperforans]|uniref:flagellar hook-length control protein FliK n=1 Tax=Peristeroidobacter agariperforans TaxID=268404 RepID=UPI00101B8DD4|nr:flagellar hook-length control protein FliK [Peristeroidobacter agariperforans]